MRHDSSQWNWECRGVHDGPAMLGINVMEHLFSHGLMVYADLPVSEAAKRAA
jgi:hypothetical protein